MVILVDENDNKLGLMEKLKAHEKGVLHRAFSVFLLNKSNELLLQKRAFSKYHSPGLWTNTCCSHPRDNETVIEAANRRLVEEMGISSSIKPLLSFIYKAEFDNGLIEHELDHVVIGNFNGSLSVDSLLTIKSDGIVEGQVVIGKLAVESGATLNAQCSMKAASVKSMVDEKAEKTA